MVEIFQRKETNLVQSSKLIFLHFIFRDIGRVTFSKSDFTFDETFIKNFFDKVTIQNPQFTYESSEAESIKGSFVLQNLPYNLGDFNVDAVMGYARKSKKKWHMKLNPANPSSFSFKNTELIPAGSNKFHKSLHNTIKKNFLWKGSC